MNIEDRLRSARLAEPSGELDRRIDAILRGAGGAPAPTGRLVRRVVLTALAPLGVAAIVAAALILRPQRAEPPARAPMVARQMEASGMFRQMLLSPPASRRPMPRLEVSLLAPRTQDNPGNSP
jgi:hypothetical protein